VGTWFHCQNCWDLDLCFKCYRSRDTLQPNCSFEETGTEYEPSPEPSPERIEKIQDYDENVTVAGSAHESSDEESEEEEKEPSNDIRGTGDSGNVAESRGDDDSDDDDDEEEEEDEEDDDN